MTWLSKALCWLGWHGPVFYGNNSHFRSQRTAGFQRTCGCCGEVWYGDEVSTRHMRTLGDWQTKGELIKNGMWKGEV